MNQQHQVAQPPVFSLNTPLLDLGDGDVWDLQSALSGTFVTGVTGAGKSSGPFRSLATAYLKQGQMGALFLTTKPEDVADYVRWATEAGRQKDIVLFDESARWRFDFMYWFAQQPGLGGSAINLVQLLEEIVELAGNDSGQNQGGQDGPFWAQTLHLLLVQIVLLPILAGMPVTLPLLDAISRSAPEDPKDVSDPEWQRTSVCAAIIAEADEKTRSDGDPEARADFEQVKGFWEQSWVRTAPRTRGIVSIMLTSAISTFLIRPLRPLFAPGTGTPTNIRPEDAFNGAIIICALPVQKAGQVVGRVAGGVWKYCMQKALMARARPSQPGMTYRPVLLAIDEMQTFLTRSDVRFQCVARSTGTASLVATQTIENVINVLGTEDQAEALIANYAAKIVAQGAGGTAEWFCKLLGERYIEVTNYGGNFGGGGDGGHQSGASFGSHFEKRSYLEVGAVSSLRRGGPLNGYMVDTILYNAGHKYQGIIPSDYPGQEPRPEMVPYKRVSFRQR